MAEIGIEIERQYQEEYEDNTVVFSANSGVFQGSIAICLDVGNLMRIGKALSTFPKKVPDEYSCVMGSNQPDDKSPYFVFRAYTRDNLGHTALQVTMNNKKDSPEDGQCCFSIIAERSGINRLGKLILKFSDWKYRTFKWSPYPDKDSLVEWEYLKLPKSPEPKEVKEGRTFRDPDNWWKGI